MRPRSLRAGWQREYHRLYQAFLSHVNTEVNQQDGSVKRKIAGFGLEAPPCIEHDVGIPSHYAVLRGVCGEEAVKRHMKPTHNRWSLPSGRRKDELY